MEGSRRGSHWPLSDLRPRGAAEVAVPSVVLGASLVSQPSFWKYFRMSVTMLGILALNEDFSGILTTATASHFTPRAVRALRETVSCAALSSYRIYEGNFYYSSPSPWRHNTKTI